jgi:hypothetical protein
MERILVPVISGGQDIWLIIHGMQLAERIGGTVYILEIDQSGNGSPEGVPAAGPKKLTTEGKAWAARAQKKEVKSEYFLVKGDFCDEVVKFCKRNRITNLVLELSPVGKKETPAQMLKMINILKRSYCCRVELVGRK